ncbi:hypothetical protein [Kribbella pratensis]|uniref:Uncharacterized protein n=1 Tax=Kribbella pratensis TaxID=2512112 RepID=A0A4R8BV23_9ACTN|nr:hypothetical protein [Kribbella pratensis]TDW65622.1 hypothetical protein EV653_5633 [Kribbella pratensis]
MTVKVRLSGDPEQIAAVVAVLREAYETAGGDRAYPNRGAFGVRVYLELRPTNPTTPPTRTSAGDTGRQS